MARNPVLVDQSVVNSSHSVVDNVDCPEDFVLDMFDWSGEGELRNESGPDIWQRDILRIIEKDLKKWLQTDEK